MRYREIVLKLNLSGFKLRWTNRNQRTGLLSSRTVKAAKLKSRLFRKVHRLTASQPISAWTSAVMAKHRNHQVRQTVLRAAISFVSWLIRNPR